MARLRKVPGYLAELGVVGLVVAAFTVDTTFGAIVAALYLLFVAGGPSTLVDILLGVPPVREDMILEPPERHGTPSGNRQRPSPLAGHTAIALTDLRPEGVVEIRGERRPARLETGFARRGATVRVVAEEGERLVVR